MITVSSQHYLNEDIVAEKIAAADFEVVVSPVFEFDGKTLRVVLDGHHSLSAAKEAGAEAVFVEATRTSNDTVALIEAGQLEAFLEATWIDGDYYDVETGESVW
ncbi:hypothetical protein [Chitinolyticbacter meiyuanensis]|uniref:hypothetical protein n=1 Tax=Chitinolyticbacter meiyuanensis TaxID=682798 RepID=UPI0011E5D905|nr:hypothetical protein [Chitinolyticbacter meiyuanensis]